MIRQGTHIIAGTPTPNTSELKAIELTKSAYQQLVDNGLVKEDQNYILIDDESPNIIDDTISSYSNTYSAAHILGLVNTLKEAVYTKAETEASINRKLISAIKYKGKVAEVENLPSLAENGDAYYVTGESLLYIYNEDLANYEALGDIVDLSAYLTEEEILELLKEKNIKFQYAVMPEASSEFDYPIQYIGATNENYKLGSWYRSISNSGTYAWEELLIEGKNKEPFETDTIPETAENGITHLYIGADNANYKKGHVYQYNNSSWNDITAGTIQLKTLPTANENELNKIYQYIGISNSNYTNGYFYKCVESNGSYTWVEKEVQKNNDVPHWTGTHAEYEAQKDTIPDYSILHFTDDYDEGGISRRYYLGTGVYDRPYLPRTITINKTGHNVVLVTVHMGSDDNYQSNYATIAFDIAGQLYKAPMKLNAVLPGYDETTRTVSWGLIHFADVTAVTQDTLTLSTEGITTGYPWFHIHVI